MATLLVN